MSKWTYYCKACNHQESYQFEELDLPKNKNRWKSCPECKSKSIRTNVGIDTISNTSMIILGSDTGGGIYSGYNIGLDTEVRDRAHYKQLAKEKGLREAS